mmetsp:Transcript_15837/g.43711  ORF Transcript_15837/g.43711 Transcript_15837/m.43711 type:complete len:173 (+) Transcript_15837:1853-2371(+)
MGKWPNRSMDIGWSSTIPLMRLVAVVSISYEHNALSRSIAHHELCMALIACRRSTRIGGTTSWSLAHHCLCHPQCSAGCIWYRIAALPFHQLHVEYEYHSRKYVWRECNVAHHHPRRPHEDMFLSMCHNQIPPHQYNTSSKWSESLCLELCEPIREESNTSPRRPDCWKCRS